MTDHTPSPATDGLRARYVSTLSEHQNKGTDVRWDREEIDWIHWWQCSCGFEIRTSDASPLWFEKHVADVLLADPAHEAAREAHRDALGRRVREVWVTWARKQPNPKPSWLVGWDDLPEPDREVDRCIGAALWGDGFAAGLDALPADLPVATGVTTEDEGRMVLGVVGETRWNHYVRRGRGDFTPCFCAATSDHQIGDEVSPAPAPVVSAGDEGVGLLSEAMARINRPSLRDSLIATEAAEWEDFARELLASDWLAARVAEAGARALREAARDLPSFDAWNEVNVYDWLDKRAQRLQGQR